MQETDESQPRTYTMPAQGWTCFHCGETFKTPGAARMHFGMLPSADPGCRIKVGAERGLLKALRDAEEQLDQAWRAIHDESTEAAKAYHAQQTRHREQLMAAEESGYEKGLNDAKDPTGWIVGNAAGTRWRTWGAMGPEWTYDRNSATRYLRRKDAEAVHENDEDAWKVEPFNRVVSPPDFKPICAAAECGDLAVTKYDGDYLCRHHATEFQNRDLEEGDMEPGFGEG